MSFIILPDNSTNIINFVYLCMAKRKPSKEIEKPEKDIKTEKGQPMFKKALETVIKSKPKK